MVLRYVSKSDIDSKKELLAWFYPKLVIHQIETVSNKDSKLKRVIKKNPLVLKLVQELDLMEV